MGNSSTKAGSTSSSSFLSLDLQVVNRQDASAYTLHRAENKTLMYNSKVKPREGRTYDKLMGGVCTATAQHAPITLDVGSRAVHLCRHACSLLPSIIYMALLCLCVIIVID